MSRTKFASFFNRSSLSKNIPILFLFIAIIGSFFSYRPTFSFGQAAGANLEISITQISLVLLVIASVLVIIKNRRVLVNDRALQLLAIFSALNTVSLFWTDNLTRGILVSGVYWLITAVWAAVIASKVSINKYRALAIRIALWTTLAVSLFAWFQVVAEALGIATAISLLPLDYTSSLFGFARPTGFALEPQFLGSLLIVPVLYTVWCEFRRTATPLTRIVLVISLSVIIATISRGALIATTLGILILLLVGTIHYRVKVIPTVLKLLAFIVLTTSLTVGLLSAAAQINTRDTVNGNDAVIKMVNHLSVGLINIPLDPESATLTQTNDAPKEPVATETQSVVTKPDNGYVEKSTESRLLMSQEALSLWSKDVRTVIFGIGTGGFGVALHQSNSTYTSASIVNNQYIEVLTELGIIGLLIFFVIGFYILRQLIRNRNWVMVAAFVAFALQWLFFSGNVNVLHIWLLLAFGYISNKPTEKVQQKV